VNPNLMDCYRAIEAASQQMLEAAQIADWNGVVRYEGACAVLIEQLRQRAITETMTAAERSDKTRIMQQILRNDAQVRLLIEPWVGELDKLLSPRIANEVH
jgi:flagellar protein FliT